MTEYAAQLAPTLRRTLGPKWDFLTDGAKLRITHRDGGTPFQPPRHAPNWPELLQQIEGAFAEAGVCRAPPLPVRWGRETDFTISAIQALDPYVKHRQRFVYREGFLPQPVVRFTGQRDTRGVLVDGFLTSFVNISRVERIGSIDDHAAILDSWITVLSQLGLHARHLTIAGQLEAWRRGPVEGVTLHFAHAGLAIGDIVLIWNATDPSFVVTDLGSGLERLRWAITRCDWHRLIFGLAEGASREKLDAVRTATLVVGSGIRPGVHGCSGALRRLLRSASEQSAELGVGRAVRQAHQFWSLVIPMLTPWPEVARRIEDELRPSAK